MILLLILFLLVAFHVITRYGRKGRLVAKIPGLYAYPFLGNLLDFDMNCRHEMWKKFRWISDKFYPITRVWFIGSAVISIRHPEDMEIILSSQKAIEKAYVYEFFHPWIKRGILTSTGAKWRHRRKILTPAFHFSILRKYLNVMNEQTEKCVKNLSSEGQEVVKEVADFTSDLTLNNICESTLGVALDTEDSKIVARYKKAVHDFGVVLVYRYMRPYIPEWMMLPIWKIGRLQRDCLIVLHGFTNRVINERRAHHATGQNKDLKILNDVVKNEADIETEEKLPMLDLLLAAEQQGLIDNEGIGEEVDTFTFAGHDTASSALTMTLMLFAENKEAQERARAEVTEVINRKGKGLQMSDLAEFTYLELCIKESLRIYPPVHTILRYTEDDLQLKHALVPGGSHIIINIFDLHRDPKFWPNPGKFDPDRFLPENTKNRHPFAYVPFSAGPRNCIGQKFALMEMKVFLAQILYKFQVEPIDRLADVKFVQDLVLRTRDPVRVKFNKIHRE